MPENIITYSEDMKRTQLLPHDIKKVLSPHNAGNAVSVRDKTNKTCRI